MPDRGSQRDRMLSGQLYLADDPELAAAHLAAARLCHEYNALAPDADDARRRVLVELLGGVGDGVEVRPPFYCDYGTQIRIGARTFVNFGLVALDCAAITIGEDVQVGPNVQLLTATHPLAPGPRKAKWESAKPITIGDNAWLGGGVVVLPGVTIGRDTVVGAGSVVTKDLPPGIVAAGNPARPLRPLPEG